MIFNPKYISFFIVNVVVEKHGYSLITAIVTGLILSVICPLTGSPIAIYLYGGVTGSGNNFLVLWLRKSWTDIFTSAFIPRITGNIVDKVLSSFLV